RNVTGVQTCALPISDHWSPGNLVPLWDQPDAWRYGLVSHELRAKIGIFLLNYLRHIRLIINHALNQFSGLHAKNADSQQTSIFSTPDGHSSYWNPTWHLHNRQ